MKKENNQQLVDNYQWSEDEKSLVTRRDVIMIGALAAGGVIAASSKAQAKVTSPEAASPSEPYIARDFSDLLAKKLDGLTTSQIEQHLKLYKGYVAKSNEIYNKLKDADLTAVNATYAPLRELLMEQSYAVNGAIYHELYFGNLGGKGGEPASELRAALEERFGSIGKFMDYLKAAGKCMRGWVVVGLNTRAGHLDVFGLDFHNMWSPANFVPILVLDVYEHAYMIDYGIDRAKYLDAFVKNLDWEIVAKRFAQTRQHLTELDATT
jgi:superoxide dismutase, Fe-Mn family